MTACWHRGTTRREARLEARLEALASRCRDPAACGTGASGDRDHVVARDVGRTRQAAREARCRLQRLAIRLPDRAGLQGQLHRDRHCGHLRLPLAQPAGDRSGQRDRHRNHDGGARRDLSGVRADARSVGGVRTTGLF
ncbi:hypothetical protein chiPu_0032476, partial [Chiloscyllium punctatum]|nr:hypothetical protein [Chiloscyllium punctatum]